MQRKCSGQPLRSNFGSDYGSVCLGPPFSCWISCEVKIWVTFWASAKDRHLAVGSSIGFYFESVFEVRVSLVGQVIGSDFGSVLMSTFNR